MDPPLNVFPIGLFCNISVVMALSPLKIQNPSLYIELMILSRRLIAPFTSYSGISSVITPSLPSPILMALFIQYSEDEFILDYLISGHKLNPINALYFAKNYNHVIVLCVEIVMSWQLKSDKSFFGIG